MVEIVITIQDGHHIVNSHENYLQAFVSSDKRGFIRIIDPFNVMGPRA